MLEKFETVRTTITVPIDLIKRSQPFIDGGSIPSRNALIVSALEHFLIALEKREIDRQFEVMAEDEAYHTLNQNLAEDFAESDWEAFTLGESE